MSSRSAAPWVKGSSLGNESYLASYSVGGLSYFVVVWRAGVITEEIVLITPRGTRTIQNAIDLAKLQQARTVAALPRS
jgi:hypothetical protein